MRLYRAGADFQAQRHAKIGNPKMNVHCKCSWKQAGEKDQHGNIQFLFNGTGQGDLSIDVQEPFGDMSSSFPPEKRVLIHTEPSLYTNTKNPQELSNYYKGLILSWHPCVSKFPQTRAYSLGGLWTSPSDAKGKKFGIGGFISPKYSDRFNGYVLRRMVLESQDKILVPSMIYNYTGSWKSSSFAYPVWPMAPCFSYMFHLAIENCTEENYFTEKLVNCFATHTIPLYFGDPLISNKFDSRGIIQLDQKRFIEQINSLTEEDFYSRVNAAEVNFELSKPYWNMYGNWSRYLEGIK